MRSARSAILTGIVVIGAVLAPIPGASAAPQQEKSTIARLYAALGMQKPAPRMTRLKGMHADNEVCGHLYWRCSEEDPPCCPDTPICLCYDNGECQCRHAGDR